MKCRKCGKDYLSQHYFKTRTICADCYDRLSSDEKKLAHERDDFSVAKEGATTHEVRGHQLKCPICKYDRFWTRRTLMNTPGLTFLGFDVRNVGAPFMAPGGEGRRLRACHSHRQLSICQSRRLIGGVDQ